MTANLALRKAISGSFHCSDPVPDSSDNIVDRTKAMDRSVSAADATRRFSELLRSVRQGNQVVITSHGKPVAKLVPVEGEQRSGTAARAILFDRLRTEQVLDVGRWTREELYEA